MSAIPFVTEFDFQYGRVDRLSPLLRRVIANNPGPFTFTGTGTYIVGNGAVGVIDPGPLLDAHIDAILAALEPNETVSHILVTHTHSDHSPAALPLQEKTGAPIYGRPTAIGQPSDAPKMEESHDDAFKPDVLVEHGQIIEGDDWTLEAVFTPGHMSNHICYALHEEKALFSGDHVMGWSTSVVVPPDGNMHQYMASLEHLLTRDDEIYWPTHGTYIKDPKNFVRAYIEHRRERERQIIQRLEAGDTNIHSMVSFIYADIDKRLHGAAAMTVLAHIEDLATRGLVTHDGATSVDGSYRLK